MKIIINGAGGRMGKVLTEVALNGGNEVVAGVDLTAENCLKKLDDFNGEADCIIDFSHHTATKELTDYAVKRKIPLVVATTAHTQEEIEMINSASKEIPVFMSANLSMGIAVLCMLAKNAVELFPDADVEIVEVHHNRKLDVPSGTALMLAREVQKVRKDSEIVVGRHTDGKRNPKEIGIHSLRLGNVVGEHAIYIATDTQTLTLKHEAKDRSVLAEGAITAGQFIVGKPAGMYDMTDLCKR